MAETTPLAQRIKAEFDARTQRRQAGEQEQAKQTQEREKRLAQFTKLCEDLQGVWRPRIEEFARQFGDKIKVTPTVTPSQREAKVSFLTNLANITLTLTASAGADVTKLVLDYDLLIIPVFFEYERHARLEVPLDKVDREAIGKWIDDRLIACVKAYLSVQDNEYYMKRAMVQDPITKAMLLPEDAKAKFEHAGKTYYFTSEESFRKFKEDHPAAPPPSPKPQAPPSVAKPQGAPAKPAAPAKPEISTKPAAAPKPAVSSKPK
jgi:YHS domain-containing protein